MLRETGNYIRGLPLVDHRHKRVPAQWWSNVDCQRRAYDEPPADYQRAATKGTAGTNFGLFTGAQPSTANISGLSEACH